MNDERNDQDVTSGAEQRLVGLLGLLAEDERVPKGLAKRVSSTARWQRNARGLLLGLGGLGAAAAGALAILIGLRGEER